MAKKKKEARPVQEIVISESHKRLRLILFIAVLAVALTAFTYGIYSLLQKDPGWREVEAKQSTFSSCAGDFHFQYKLGAGATAEYKKVQQIYTDAAVYMYAVFSTELSAQVPGNVYAVNASIGEEVEVDPVLYQAFSLMKEQGGRYLYLAPIYEYYENIFSSNENWELESFDPRLSEDVAQTFAEICAFINDPEAINLELLGGNKVRLIVADEYADYAKDNEITTFIDFYWLKNAFILDYLADTLISEGFTRGYITSVDGFSASLGGVDETLSSQIYDWVEGEGIYAAAVLQYTGELRIAAFHDYTTQEVLGDNFYTLANGETRTPYIDPRDGLCKASLHDLLVCSDSSSLAETVLSACPVFIADAFDASTLPVHDVGTVYCQDRTVYHSAGLTLTDIFASDDLVYQEKVLE